MLITWTANANELISIEISASVLIFGKRLPFTSPRVFLTIESCPMPARTANIPRLELSALTGSTEDHVISMADPVCRLHAATAAALLQLRAAALLDGVELLPVSGFRSFEHQLRIWNEKFRGQRPLLSRSGMTLDVRSMPEDARVEAILQWSALPGASRHHWGTDLDVIDRASLPNGESVNLLPEEYSVGGRFFRLYQWLTANAADYGFFWPYDADRGGVQPEPWHLSFAPIAQGALNSLTPDLLAAVLAAAKIDGAAVIYSRLPELHQRFVMAVADAPARALTASALAP
jgi:LAS superfamily LD-carboxypeptidase LdcB